MVLWARRLEKYFFHSLRAEDGVVLTFQPVLTLFECPPKDYGSPTRYKPSSSDSSVTLLDYPIIFHFDLLRYTCDVVVSF